MLYALKKGIFFPTGLVFCLFFSLHTEGVAQNGDSIVINAEPAVEVKSDEVNDAEMEPYTIPESQQKYYDQSLETRQIDEKDWQKAKNGLDYTLKPKEQKPKEETKKDVNKPNIPPVNPNLAAFLKWFFIIVAAGILVFLIARFISEGNIFGRRSHRIYTPSVSLDLEKIEENLLDIDLDAPIKKAIAEKQFNLAIRLYFLAIIKELSLQKAINWKKDKTNREYTAEMRQHRFSQSFQGITRIFERVWYGGKAIDETTFISIEPDFKDLLSQTRIK